MNLSSRSAAWYEARVAFGLTAILPLLILPTFALLKWLSWREPYGSPSLDDLRWGFENLLPLAALGAAHLMTVERQVGFAELRRSYPEQPWRLPLTRTTGALLLLLLGALASALCFLLAYGRFPLSDVVLPAFAPALLLLGSALLLGNLTGSYWIAAGAVVGYWFFEKLTGGTVTRTLYLFNHSLPLTGVSETLNRTLLVGIGAGLLLLNGYVSARRIAG